MSMNTAPMHLDAEYAAGSEFGRPLVNSMFTAALVVGLSVAELTQGTIVAQLGFSVEFPAPVFTGDTIRVDTEVVEARPSQSRPNAGVVVFEHRGYNQRDELVCRQRLELLLDPGSWVEDGLLASAAGEALPADGVLTGVGTIEGRPVAVIAHDFTVKAGSWGALTCEKQVRILERADRDLLPVFYLVDSAGGRLTDQLGFFAGRRGAARIFHLQVNLSGRVPQLCCLLGPSAAGGAYMPAFTDWVGMVEGNASMYLASPRIAEKVTGEVTTLEEMGGARMHATVSGCADEVFAEDWQVIAAARLLLSYLPDSWQQRPALQPAAEPELASW